MIFHRISTPFIIVKATNFYFLCFFFSCLFIILIRFFSDDVATHNYFRRDGNEEISISFSVFGNPCFACVCVQLCWHLKSMRKEACRICRGHLITTTTKILFFLSRSFAFYLIFFLFPCLVAVCIWWISIQKTEIRKNQCVQNG